MKKKLVIDNCKVTARAVKDSIEILSGKWTFVILAALQERTHRFKELGEFLSITPRMLSRELKILETNHLIKRTVLKTKPVTVEYQITEHGRTLDEVILSLEAWGIKHRKEILKQMKRN